MKRMAFEPTRYGVSNMDARDVLQQNLKALMASSPKLNTTPAIERATKMKGCKVGKSTVDRLLRSETPVKLDYIEAIAKIYDLDPWQLLVPGLRPNNPPVLKSVGEAEDKLYGRLNELAKQIVELSPDPKE